MTLPWTACLAQVGLGETFLYKGISSMPNFRTVRKVNLIRRRCAPAEKEPEKDGNSLLRSRCARKVIGGLRRLCTEIISVHGGGHSALKRAGERIIEQIQNEEVRTAWKAGFPLVLGHALKRWLAIKASKRRQRRMM